MTEPAALLQATLKRHRYSLTVSRQAVFESLQHTEPLTMHEIIEACGGRADRASVYRAIALFERLGIVQRLHIGWKYKLELTDVYSHHHHHLSCTGCGQVIALAEDHSLEQQLKALAGRHGFLPESHQLEIRGRCASCQSS